MSFLQRNADFHVSLSVYLFPLFKQACKFSPNCLKGLEIHHRMGEWLKGGLFSESRLLTPEERSLAPGCRRSHLWHLQTQELPPSASLRVWCHRPHTEKPAPSSVLLKLRSLPCSLHSLTRHASSSSLLPGKFGMPGVCSRLSYPGVCLSANTPGPNAYHNLSFSEWPQKDGALTDLTPRGDLSVANTEETIDSEQAAQGFCHITLP